MRLFNTLSLEISSRCNRRCKFCPVAYNHRPDEQLDNVLLFKALIELKQLRYKGRIEFYIYNEPMRDKGWLHYCLQEARRLVPGSTLMIATNGDYIKGADDIMDLYDNGLNQLLINCYSKGLYQRRWPWLLGLLPGVNREKSVYSATGPKSKVIEMLDKSDPSTFGEGVFGLINRAGNIPAFKPAMAQPMERMCVKPFRLLNVNWQGDGLVCCNDYHGEMGYANLRDHSLVQLWNHPVMQTYRARLWQHNREQPLCNVCDCHAGAYPANVDHSDKEQLSQLQLYTLQINRRASAQADR